MKTPVVRIVLIGLLALGACATPLTATHDAMPANPAAEDSLCSIKGPPLSARNNDLSVTEQISLWVREGDAAMSQDQRYQTGYYALCAILDLTVHHPADVSREIRIELFFRTTEVLVYLYNSGPSCAPLYNQLKDRWLALAVVAK